MLKVPVFSERLQSQLGAGPGLVKARPLLVDDALLEHGYSVVSERRPTYWHIRETWVRQLLEEADTFSEGDCTMELTGRGERRFYYGSTSLRCPIRAVRARIEGLQDGEFLTPTELAGALLADPHARLCAIRIARREACARAGGALNVMHAELSARVLCEADGVRLAIDVDVSAELARLHAGVLHEE